MSLFQSNNRFFILHLLDPQFIIHNIITYYFYYHYQPFIYCNLFIILFIFSVRISGG